MENPVLKYAKEHGNSNTAGAQYTGTNPVLRYAAGDRSHIEYTASSPFDAPVVNKKDDEKKSTKSKDDKRKWYQKGYLEDGYDFGDISKTILFGSEEERAERDALISSGMRDANLLDITLNSLNRGYYNSRLGEESYKAMFGDKNDKATYEEILAGDEFQFVPSNSLEEGISGAFELLGQQARQWTHPRSIAGAGAGAGAALIAGQAGPQVALPEEIVTVPGAALIGLQAGSATVNLEIEAGLAYNEMIEAGVSEETAKAVALGVGGVNAALEALQLDELAKAFKVAKKGTSKTAASLIAEELKRRGKSVAVETAQEVAQEGVTMAGVEAASRIDKGESAYTSEEAVDRLLDTAKSSALSFGMMNIPAGAKNTVSILADQKAANTLTDNDKKVIDKLVENSIAEAEKDGKELTDKEKAKLYDKVMESVERGEVSFDTIAEVLDKESYDAYKKLTEEEEKAVAELAELYEGEELQQEVAKFLEGAESKSVRSELDKKVFDMVKDGKLAESYLERGRRSQAYEADLSKYDEKQRVTIQNAINSGVLNNTRRTHEFVDLIAKISADKGIAFDFTNNEKLKGSMFAVEGKTVNGYVTDGGITLNIDSAKSLNSLVGHEITHVLEGTNLYGDLQNILFEYAKSRKSSDGKFDSEYKERLYNARQLYKDVDGYQGVQGFEKIKQEVVADLVGDYLFTDSDFVNNLVKHKNLFQMIWDEIKYLHSVAKAGSKEEKQLLEVKRAFEKAYRDNGKAKDNRISTDEGTVFDAIVGKKYSLNNGENQVENAQQQEYTDATIKEGATYGQRETVERGKSAFEGHGALHWEEVSSDHRSATERRADFTRRMGQSGAKTHKAEARLYGYRAVPLRRSSSYAKEAVSAFKRFGFKDYFVFDEEVQVNYAGVTHGHSAIGTTLADGLVGINNAAANDPEAMPANETAAHEVIHSRLIAEDPDAEAYYEVLKANVLVNNEVFDRYMAAINTSYFGGNFDYANEEHRAKFFGELSAYVAGHIYASTHDVQPMLADYAAVHAALEKALRTKIETMGTGTRYSLSDSEYLAAVERGDMDTAQKMVDEAAKAAGYDSPKLYHGTTNFGFTKIDTTKSDDALSFFTTESMEVAQTYSGSNKVRMISETVGEDSESIEKAFNDAQIDLCTAINRASGYQSHIDYNAFDGFLERITTGAESVEGVVQDFRNYVQDIIDDLFFRSEYYDQANRGEKSEDDAIIDFEESADVQNILSHEDGLAFILEGAATDETGNYQFYANTSNLFEIDAKGKRWSEIPFDEYDTNGFYPVVNTRQAARYAKANGFDGVKITNVFDDGGRSKDHQKTPATIYIFFNPQEQVKSADPVTYDDNGNVIPLSERFNPKNDDIRYSLSEQNAEHPVYGDYNVYGEDVAIAPVAENATVEDIAPVTTPVAKTATPVDVSESPVLNRLNKKLSNSNEELENNKRLRDESNKSFDEKIAKAQAELDAKANKDTQEANAIKRRIERLQRLKADRDSEYTKRIGDISARVSRTEENIAKYHPGMDRAEKAVERIDKMLEYDKAELEKEYNKNKALLADRNAYISSKASELYDEIRNLKKGVRASALLGELLDSGYEWSSIRSALTNIKYTPDQIVNVNSTAESRAREILNEDYENSVYNLDEDYAARVKQLEDEAAKKRKSSTVAYQRKKKQQEYYDQMAELAGDTSTWVDKKLGISYRTNTLKRNLRDIVRDAKGNRDIAKADAIYNELQGKYNTHEAMLNRESTQIKKPYADMKITKAEDEYIQMLGEFRHNPDTTLTEDVVKEFYEKHKKDIDTAKVDKAIEMARQTYDELLIRVNNVLREQGMKEIPYRKGYFPHFTEEKQSFLAKLFNWKVRNNDIPTDIAGLTENFNPNRSWQSFNKQRKSDITDYSFTRGMDTYVQGALDWVYHIEDIQKRRAFENYIRYIHSDKGVQEKIDAIKRSDEYDADEAQEQIDLVLNEARNPLNNFVTDLRAGTNTLANKKSSLDRTVEELTSRKFYSVMTNVSNRVSANMVAGSVSSALTNFIPITQSWGEVSPISSLRAMGETLRSTFRDDGMVNKSDFLTNRLRKADNLYKTGWDKVSDKVGLMMEAVDSFTSQTVWRSKYLENISKGMSENEAIANADQFAESVMAGRSRGNMPTIFDSKNPLVKTLTAFQLEVANQYGYMFKDMPQDMKNESVGKLVKGYATMFLGAYAYNALYSSLTGRDAAFDPIGIIEELLRDLGLFGEDEEEEPVDTVMNLAENVLEEVPFVGGLMGGGRIPISSAIPYDGNVTDFIEGASKLVLEGDTSDLTTEWLKPVYYLALPMGGGQIKKTAQGLAMFSDDHPIAGSYTKSGNLRFPVEDTIGNRAKAAIFGQYANKNAREYFDNNLSPLKEKQIQELIEVDLPISEYWAYRKGLAQQKTVDEKLDYIAGLDLPIAKKNILANNAVTRKNPINMADYE